jgi:plastocyanin
MEQVDQLWTALLDLLAQVVTPAWGDLIQYVPLLLLMAIGGIVLLLAWAWRRHDAANRPRLMPRRPPGRMPADVHLPGPSIWPFVGPVGLGLMVFAVALGLRTTVELLLLGAGATIGLVGVIGWLVEASREYRTVEAGAHGEHGTGAATPALGSGPERTMPEGIHLPGPSAWPFLAPIGMAFAVLGLIFGPALLIGGIVMGAIASIGWLRDAGREYRQVEAHGHAEPETRDPVRAFPRSLIPVYAGVAAVAIALTALPGLLAMLPGTADVAAPVGPEPTTTPYVSAVNSREFEQAEVAVVAGQPFSMTFENKEVGVPHNVAIYDSPDLVTLLFLGEIFPGPDTRVYEVDALPAGTYTFICSVHPNMVSTLHAR